MLKADFQSTAVPSSSAPTASGAGLVGAKVEKTSDGKLALNTKSKILSNHGDPYAKDCKF